MDSVIGNIPEMHLRSSDFNKVANFYLTKNSIGGVDVSKL
jgi:hypothetical protein